MPWRPRSESLHLLQDRNDNFGFTASNIASSPGNRPGHYDKWNSQPRVRKSRSGLGRVLRLWWGLGRHLRHFQGHIGSRAARLYAPVTGQYGGVCDEAADAVRASIRQPISATVTAADIVNSPGSFSARWYVLPDGESVYSVRAGIWLDGYRLEYNYGISGLQNTSTVLSYNLGPVPVGQWFETRRNLYTDLVPLKLPSTVRISYVWFASLGDCVNRGEIAWVDNTRLFYHGDTYTAPQAQITPSVSSGAAPLTVELNPLPGAYIESYSWVSDEGVRGSGLTWTHTFSSVGEHSVTLTVQDSNGEINIQIQKISVIPANALQSLPIYLASGGFLSLAIILVLFKRRLGRKFQD